MLTTSDYEYIMDSLQLEMTELEQDGGKGCPRWQRLRLIYRKVRAEQLQAANSLEEVAAIIDRR